MPSVFILNKMNIHFFENGMQAFRACNDLKKGEDRKGNERPCRTYLTEISRRHDANIIFVLLNQLLFQYCAAGGRSALRQRFFGVSDQGLQGGQQGFVAAGLLLLVGEIVAGLLQIGLQAGRKGGLQTVLHGLQPLKQFL